MVKQQASVAPHHAPVADIYWVSLDEIEPNPFQPRVLFDQGDLQELADSIRKEGVLQNVLLRPIPDNDPYRASKLKAGIRYQLVFGERRWRASRLAGRPQLPARIRDDIDDLRARELALTENLKQKSLTDYEEAKSIMDLWAAYEAAGQPISQGEMHRRLNVSPTFISNRKKLMLTRPEVQAVAKKHRGVTSSLLLINPLKDEDLFQELLRGVDKGMPFRAVEERIGQAAADARWQQESQRPDSYTRSAISQRQARERQALSQVQAALVEMDRQIANLESWLPEVNPREYRPRLAQQHKRLGKLL